LLGLAFSPEDGTPLVGIFAEQDKQTALWRYADGRWQLWLSCSNTWAGLTLAAAGERGERSWAALGGQVYAHTEAGWRRAEIAGHEGDVAGITAVSPTGSRYLIRGSTVLCHDATGKWRSLPLPQRSAAPFDLCLLPSGVLVCLDGAGTVWRLDS
jgi:hypothetical protein